jgi:NAD(P)-dependent dehydrogenase (short-subunit alcohol dehydrogenase family)
LSSKTWFITGTSRGFGREWALAALERGDTVAATARNPASLDDLVVKYGDAVLPIALDVTDRDADFAAVAQAHDHFGKLDVVINNAGMASSASSKNSPSTRCGRSSKRICSARSG